MQLSIRVPRSRGYMLSVYGDMQCKLASLIILLLKLQLTSSADDVATVLRRPDGCSYHGKIDGLFSPDTPAPRIIVTGGAGFIGVRLVKELARDLRQGQVKVIDNFGHGGLHNLQDEAGKWVVNVSADLCQVDLRDAQLAERYIRGADTVFHLADSAGAAELIPNGSLGACSDNLLINANTIVSAKDNGIRTFIYSSTAFDTPQEADWDPKTSKDFILSMHAGVYNPYLASKIMGEYLASQAGSHDFQVGIVRLPGVYGPRMRQTNSTEQELRKLLAGWQTNSEMGRAPADFKHIMHIDDAVKALIAVKEKGLGKGPVSFHQGVNASRPEALGEAVKRPSGTHARVKQESTYGRMATSRHDSTTSHWPGHHDAGLEAGIRSTLHWIEQTVDQPRVLVILVGQARGGDLAWQSLRQHVILPHNAHLALMFTDDQPTTHLHSMAQYSWSVPEYTDWGVVLDYVAEQCEPSASRMPWRELCRVPELVGGVAACTYSRPLTSAGKLLALRWVLQQKMDRLNLGSKYDWFVLSRSDELHACKHPDIGSLDPKFAWVPEGEHYGGWSDRHIIASAEVFAKVINLTAEVVCNTALHLPKLLNASSTAAVNIEQLQKLVWEAGGVSVREVNRTMFLVKTSDDPSSRSPGFGHDLLAQYGLLLKYGSEMSLLQERCPTLPEALHRLQQGSLEDN